MFRLVITATAELHTLNACIYYDNQQIGLAGRFLTELKDAYNKISEHPEYYAFISPDRRFRDVRLQTFPFVVIYEINDNEVIIVAVFNTHKKPMY